MVPKPSENRSPARRAASLEVKGPGGTLRIPADDVAAYDLAMLVQGETSGRPLEEVLAAFGRSRSTYYEKLHRFDEHGLAGLVPRPPGPQGPWRRPIDILRFVVSTRIRRPEQSAAAIAAELERLGHRISVRSVERTLSQFGLTRTPVRSAKPAAKSEPPAGPTAPPATPVSSG